jgi:hypothetical protein
VCSHLILLTNARELTGSLAYIANCALRIYICTLPHAAFQAFILPSNTPAQILLAHYVAMHLLMTPIKTVEWAGRNMAPANRDKAFFVKPIRANIPDDFKEFMRRPLEATGGGGGGAELY